MEGKDMQFAELSDVNEEESGEESEVEHNTSDEGFNYDEMDEFQYAKVGFKLDMSKMRLRSNSTVIYKWRHKDTNVV